MDNLTNGSSLNPNASPFQTFAPQPAVNNYQINQQRNLYPNNYINVQNQQNQNNYLFTYNYPPHASQQRYNAIQRQANMHSNLAGTINESSSLPRVEHGRFRSNGTTYYQQNISTNRPCPKPTKPTVPKCKKIIDERAHKQETIIYYDTCTLEAPSSQNANILKSQTCQPYRHGTDSVLHLLVSGYCHNIEGIKRYSIPNDLFSLFMDFYGYKNAKIIGYCPNKAGFAVFDYMILKTVYFIPKNLSSMDIIVCSASNIKLPFHIINEYKIFHQMNAQKIDKSNRFDVLFFHTIGFGAIVFNDNFALELVFPRHPLNGCNRYGTKPCVYSDKYGFLVCVDDGLISFSLKTWKWTVIERNAHFFTEDYMCLLEKESKLCICGTNGKGSGFCFYDFNTSKFESVPHLLGSLPLKPAFCCDETNRRMYVLPRNGEHSGKVSYFDLDTFEWTYNAFPKRKGMQQIWIGDDKNILFGVCRSRKRLVFSMDLRMAKQWKKVFSFRPFMGSDCNTYFKL